MKRNLKRMAAFGLAMTMAVGSTAAVNAAGDSTQGGSTSTGQGGQTKLKSKFTVVMPYVANLSFEVLDSAATTALTAGTATNDEVKKWDPATDKSMPSGWVLGSESDDITWSQADGWKIGSAAATVTDLYNVKYAPGSRLVFKNSNVLTEFGFDSSLNSKVANATGVSGVTKSDGTTGLTKFSSGLNEAGTAANTTAVYSASNYSDWVWMQNRSDFDVYVEASARWISHTNVELVDSVTELTEKAGKDNSKAYLYLAAQVDGLEETFVAAKIATSVTGVKTSDFIRTSDSKTIYDKDLYRLSKDPLDDLISMKDGKSYFILGAQLPYAASNASKTVGANEVMAWNEKGKNGYVDPNEAYGLWPTIGFRLTGEAAGTWTRDCETTLEFVWRISTPGKSQSSNTTLNLNYTTLDKTFDLNQYAYPDGATKITGVEWNGYSMLEDIAGLGQMASVDKMNLTLHSVALTNLFQENEMVTGNEIKVTVTFDKGDPVVYTVNWNKYGNSDGNN